MRDLDVFQHISVFSIALGVTAAATHASPTIDHLAPANSIVVAGVNDFRKVLKSLKSTPLWSLWTSDDFTAMFEEPLEEFHEEFGKVLDELGLDADDVSWPQGPVGLAIFPGSPQDPDAGPGYLAMADYGIKAHRMNRVVNAVLDRVREEQQIEIPEQEVLGRTVYTIDLRSLAGEQLVFDADDFGLDDMSMLPMLDPQEMMDQFNTAYYVRDGRRFMLCSDLGVLRNALEFVDEDGQSELADRADFLGAVGQLGVVDGYAVVLLGELAGLMPGGPMAMMVQMMFQQIVGDVQAVGFGFRISDGDDGVMVEETIGVYMPNGKAGLSKLFAHETPHGTVPRFVGPGSVSYGRFNFRFDGIMGFLRDVAAANPMLGAQLDQMLVEYGPTIDKVCSALGPEIHTVATLTRPLKIDSLKTLYAIESTRPGEIEAVLAEYAAGLGLESRDFLGHRIYSMEGNPLGIVPEMMPGGEGFSIGFGGGYVMLGNTSVVEDGLRAMARADMPGLDDDPAYRRALRAMSSQRSVGWGVVDLVDYIEYFKGLGSMMNRQVLQRMKQWDPDDARQLEHDFADVPELPWANFDVRTLDRYMGPLAWEIRSRDDGFVMRYVVMQPE